MSRKERSGSRTKRQVLFVQGGGADVHDQWDNKLVDSLKRELGSNYEIRYPRMPNESDPQYADWKRALEQEIESMDDDAIVVGHSIGGTMLVNVLAVSSFKAKLGAVFLVSAPFVGEGGWPSEELKSPMDLGAKLPEGIPIHVYHGLRDEAVPPQHADLYKRAIPQAEVHRVADRDHQFNNDLKEVAEAIKTQ
jgi:predicted alpha/beta hydrolase family esterase